MITASDIVTLYPLPDEIKEGVRYAVMSSATYTYNRMAKEAVWKRAARVARGKVNEYALLRFLTKLGLDPETQQDKTYRQSDMFDFIFRDMGKEVRSEPMSCILTMSRM
ncbi:MAG: hypothetical protein LBC63_10070 [Holophagales bacterium]|jgi:hypothetical protein|nr:hypothetical protein [Holophagales bacterium]